MMCVGQVSRLTAGGVDHRTHPIANVSRCRRVTVLTHLSLGTLIEFSSTSSWVSKSQTTFTCWPLRLDLEWRPIVSIFTSTGRSSPATTMVSVVKHRNVWASIARELLLSVAQSLSSAFTSTMLWLRARKWHPHSIAYLYNSEMILPRASSLLQPLSNSILQGRAFCCQHTLEHQQHYHQPHALVLLLEYMNYSLSMLVQ